MNVNQLFTPESDGYTIRQGKVHWDVPVVSLLSARAAPLVKRRQYLAYWEKRGTQKAQTRNKTTTTKQRNIKV